MKVSVFKSQKSRDKFRSYYQDVLDRFPFEQHYIDTTLGPTFLLAAGQETDPPVILLHGSCSNSAFWFPEIMALSAHYRVYAIDLIGEAGNSSEYRPDLDSDDFSAWMKEVLDTLGIKKSVIAGNSLGGWMALKFASSWPEYVSKLLLFASAGLAQIRPQFIDDTARILQTSQSAQVDSDVLGENELPKEVLDFMNLILESYDPIPYLPVFSDEQLQRLDMPVLFVGGENDIIIDTEASANRLSHLVPSARTLLLENCGHVIPNVAGYLTSFLAEGENNG